MPQTVLVVDDDPLTQRILQRYLERAGYSMKSAKNGREAIRLAKRDMPQLIILDVMMPDMDGWTALKQIRKTETTKDIPVIVLTSNADLAAQEESSRSGATLLQAKPINAGQFLSVIRKLAPVIRADSASDKTRS
jgi:CheY-like chemotaxis protein